MLRLRLVKSNYNKLLVPERLAFIGEETYYLYLQAAPWFSDRMKIRYYMRDNPVLLKTLHLNDFLTISVSINGEGDGRYPSIFHFPQNNYYDFHDARRKLTLLLEKINRGVRPPWINEGLVKEMIIEKKRITCSLRD